MDKAVSLKYVRSEELEGNEYVQKHMRQYSSYGMLREKVLTHIRKTHGKDSKILDVGCGAGRFEEKLLAEGYKNLEFCDVDNYLEHVPKEYKKRFRKVNLNHEKLPYRDGQFDVVVCIFVLEHIENPYHFAREANRVLKKGGELILIIPSAWQIFERLYYLLTGNSTEYVLGNNHTIYFSKDMFIKPFIFNGFKQLKQEYSFGVFPYLRFHLPANSFFGVHVAGYFKKTGK